LIIGLRGHVLETGRIPPTIRDALENVYKHGNPWGRPKAKRAEWAEAQRIKRLGGEVKADNILFTCCASAYDSRGQQAATALAKTLERLGVDFGILGEAEACCGNEAYNMGEQGLFELLSEQNVNQLNRFEGATIITTSPHCYNAFKNRYKGLKLPAQHYTQLLASLVDQGRLKPSGRVEAVATYHDPCYLGRHNGIFDEPRKVIESIPGLKLVEMERARRRSLCCEGGGGRMWHEGPPGSRLSEQRILEALDAGASILVVTCPFCVSTLEDAVKTLGKEEELKVMDLAELLLQAL
jgi:Fe-S oxidoreductase